MAKHAAFTRVVTVQAEQFFHDKPPPFAELCLVKLDVTSKRYHVTSPEGWLLFLNDGDWVVKYPQEYYRAAHVVTDGEFRKHFTPVPEKKS